MKIKNSSGKGPELDHAGLLPDQENGENMTNVNTDWKTQQNSMQKRRAQMYKS